MKRPPTPTLDAMFIELRRYLAWRLIRGIPPRKPRPVIGVRQLREEPAVPRHVYLPELPPPGAPDVVRRTLTVELDDGTTSEIDVTTGPQEFTVPEGKVVTLTLTETDDAGLEGEPSDPFSFTAIDVTAPSKAGMVGVKHVREEQDEVPPPEPEPVPTPEPVV